MRRLTILTVWLTIAFHGFAYNDFEVNPNLSEEEIAAFTPYLLPEDHPLKPLLDALFLFKRVNYTPLTVQEAGFLSPEIRPMGGVVSSHPLFPGIVFKFYCDDPGPKPRARASCFRRMFHRVDGARRLSDLIALNHLQCFLVPKKWIYPLPLIPEPPAPCERKDLVLLAEEFMGIDFDETRDAWQNLITKRHLDELFLIVKTLRLRDMRGENIPYVGRGRFAFIDLEFVDSETTDYTSIRAYLSKKMLKYWDKLVEGA